LLLSPSAAIVVSPVATPALAAANADEPGRSISQLNGMIEISQFRTGQPFCSIPDHPLS